MTDITVDKATIALALEAIELNWRTDEGDAVTPILRAALAEPAPVQEPVLLQCMGCERIGTQEQLSASTDCDCWLHTQPAPVQEQQFTADELDLMRQWFESMQDTNRSFVIDADKKLHQKIIAAIQAAPRAEQPRKAVKLSDSEG